MENKPLMIITLGVTPEKEGEFNEFYHHRFLPAILSSGPEVMSIRRYEELSAMGTIRLHVKQYVTIYELSEDEILERSDSIFQKEALRDLVTEFQAWKNNDLRHFSRINYRAGWQYSPESPKPFGNRPFIQWALETDPEVDEEFNAWYEGRYLPMQIADIPGWSAVRRYHSVGREQQRDLTFFEAADETTLKRTIDDLGALHRVNQNREWKRRVDRAARWHEVKSFRCVYCRFC